MNRNQKAGKSSVHQDPSNTSAKLRTKSESGPLKRRAPMYDKIDPGGGSNEDPLVHINTLIEPEKKCDKGGYREDQLARQMGIARQYLRNFRSKDLTQGKDWSFDGSAVIWHNTAIDGLLNYLRLDIEEIPTKQTPHLLQIKKFYTNKQLLGCTDPCGDKNIIQSVRVRDANKFNHNQLIPVEFVGSSLVLACRHPRTKGKLK